MDVTAAPVTSSSTTSGTTSAASASSPASIAGNFNEFLTLLTTQLQNQNPLDPLDTNQFTQQLVQFASVEQQINMNTSLSTLISLQQTSQATSALGFVGQTATVKGSSAQLANGQATWTYSVPKTATATINITSSTGQLVYSTTQTAQAGTQTFTWNGQDAVGNTWPAGTYTMSVSAIDASGQPVTATTQIQGVVTGVDLSETTPQLIIGGQSYPLSQVTQIGSSGS